MPETNTVFAGSAPSSRQGALHRLEDRVVAAARAPADLLVALPVLGGGLDGGHVVHARYPLNQAIRNRTTMSKTISGQALIGFISAR